MPDNDEPGGRILPGPWKKRTRLVGPVEGYRMRTLDIAILGFVVVALAAVFGIAYLIT